MFFFQSLLFVSSFYSTKIIINLVMFNPSLTFLRLSRFRSGKSILSRYLNVSQFSVNSNSFRRCKFIDSLSLTYFFRTNQIFKKCLPVKINRNYLLLSGLLGIFHDKKEEEESELIITIKRAVLLIQRDEFDAAEQMLHVALRLAQEQQNGDGITYVYDLLANVAFSQGHYPKAEKLFLQVMNRLLAGGVQEDDIKINHMSLKLAKIYEEAKDYVKAEEGYRFCVKNLEKRVEEDDKDEDALSLWAMSLDWYARFLLERERMDEALGNFQKAYKMSLKVNGEIHEQTVVLLNDLGTINFLMGKYEEAIEHLQKAIEIGRHLPNMEDFSSVHVNLGNIFLQRKLYAEAEKYCLEGFKNATRHKNVEGIHEANICLEELKKVKV